MINLLMQNWDYTIIALALLLPVIPPTWAGQNASCWNIFLQKWEPSKKINLLNAIVSLAISPLINIIVFLSLKGTVSLIIFLVIATDLFYRKQISREAIILIGIGLLALYLDQLIEKGKKFTFLKLLDWESKDSLNK